jgi:hypothetical protein
MAVVYLKSIPEEGLLNSDTRFLLFYQSIQPLGYGGVVLTNHAALNLVFADGFLNA